MTVMASSYSDNQISSADLDLLLTTGAFPEPWHHHDDFFKEHLFFQCVEEDATSIVEHHLKKNDKNCLGTDEQLRHTKKTHGSWSFDA